MTLNLHRKSEKEHKYTSTGVKFWKNLPQMESYRDGTGKSIISTHISPEGSCNLNCGYCSVKKREKNFRIELDAIKDYVSKLKSRGLRAVILTGGGEPTLYPYFNELVDWIKNEQKLNIALITNGTLEKKVKPETWKSFSWVRVSINDFPHWEDKINIPKEYLDKDCVVGCSSVYTGQDLDFFKRVEKLAKKFDSKYVRLLPNCLLNQSDLIKEHEKLDKLIKKLDTNLFFHQHKIHGVPNSDICHQSYFRPYLSEVDGGTVYPCDSLVLNEEIEHFSKKYQICKAKDILDFLDGKIKMKFNPKEDCTGCVFTENVNMLNEWKKTGKSRNIDPKLKVIHEEFP